jgi:F-type H+-transporting ATPase subunit alpha
MAAQVEIFWALNKGFMDDVPVEKVQDFEAAFHGFMGSNHPEISEKIADEKILSPEIEAALEKALKEFKETVPY